MVDTDKIVEKLQELLPAENVLHSQRDLLLYEYDASLERHQPQAVAMVESTEQVAGVVALCASLGVPFTARGSGTNLSGGSVAIAGGVLIELARMDKILDLDTANLRAVVQPGVLNFDLQTELEALDEGYFYAPDPASQNVCTLGGNIAENAGGPHCFKYGVTTNHVLGLEVVLPGGQVTRFGGKALDPPGYDFTGLFVGSEGTLGICTEITCRIMRLAEVTATMLVVFDSLVAAGQAVSDIIAAGIVPATLEMMDKFILRAVEEATHAGYPLDAEAVLIVEVDGLREGIQRQVDRVREICERNGCRHIKWAHDPEERELLWQGRRGAFGAVARLAPNKLTTDVTVPRTELPRMLGLVRELGAKYNLDIGNVFHAGDGNLHPNILFDQRDEEMMERVMQANAEITRLAVECGGVLSGEHGIGLEKKKAMLLMFSPTDIETQLRVKEAFDPDGLANPEKIFPAVEPKPERLALPDEELDFIQGFREILGPAEVVVAEDPSLHATQLSPRSYEEVQQCLAWAQGHAASLFVFGRGTKIASLPPAEKALSVTTSDLDQMVDLDHDNLVVTAQAGVKLSDLQRALAKQGQQIPLDPPWLDEGATLGGVLAANSSGPRRLRYGTARDLTLGLRVVRTDGQMVRCGGITVKNVAGYDLVKLLIGSRGTLGVICEATLRALPLPEASATFACAFRNQTGAVEAALRLLRTQLEPATLELLNPCARDLLSWHYDVLPQASEPEYLMLIALEGPAESVARQLDDLPRHASSAVWTERLEGETVEAMWAAHAALGSGDWAHDACAAKVAVPIARVGEAMTRVQIAAQEAGLDCALRASAGNGIVQATLGADEPAQEATDQAWSGIAQAARDLGGHVQPEPPLRWPGDPVWEMPAGVVELWRRVKAAWDPDGLLPELSGAGRLVTAEREDR